MSPRTRLAFLLVVLVTVAVCVRLGLWQLGRLRERRAANATARIELAAPESDLNAATPARPGRRVRVTGVYDHARELVIRGQVHREQPGVLVVTPLRLEGKDQAVLVIRGFVPAADATTVNVDSLVEPGRQVVRGVSRPLEQREDGGSPIARDGRTTWRGLDSAAVAAALPYPLAGIVVQQSADSTLPRLPRRLPPPVIDDGPHLSYTIQWFAFATIALVGGVALMAGPRRSRAHAPSPGGPPSAPPVA